MREHKTRLDTTRQGTTKTVGFLCCWSLPRRCRNDDDAQRRPEGEYKTWGQGKTRTDKTKEDKSWDKQLHQPKQNTTRWHNHRLNNCSNKRQDKTRHVKTRQDKTRQDKTRQDKTRGEKTPLCRVRGSLRWQSRRWLPYQGVPREREKTNRRWKKQIEKYRIQDNTRGAKRRQEKSTQHTNLVCNVWCVWPWRPGEVHAW